MVKDGEYPELRIKAYAGRILVAFLQELVRNLVASFGSDDIPQPLPLVHGAMTHMCTWLLQIEGAPRFLSRSQADAIWNTSLPNLA